MASPAGNGVTVPPPAPAPEPAPEPVTLPRIKSDVPEVGPPVSNIPPAPSSATSSHGLPSPAPPSGQGPPPSTAPAPPQQQHHYQQHQPYQQQPAPPSASQPPASTSPAGQSRPLRWASVAVPGQQAPTPPMQGQPQPQAQPHYQGQHQPQQHPQAPSPHQQQPYYQHPQHPPPPPQYQQQHPPPGAPQHHAAPPQYQQHQGPPPPPQQQQQQSGVLQPPASSMARKPMIMDPPGNKIPAAQIQQSGFPSPNIDHGRANPKFLDDFSRLMYGIHQSLPESVRRAVRDNWEKCLLGSDFHQAFVMNAIIHHASPSVTQRAFRDFGAKMVETGRSELIRHFSSADLDAVADIIFASASNDFLDRALDIRLRTIEAKPLINKLAMAERLGYDPGDIVEDGRGQGQERVIPTENYPGSHQQHHQPPPQHHAPPPQHHAAPPQGYAHVPQGPPPTTPQAQGPPGSSYQCPNCYRLFNRHQPFEHHMKKQVCQRTPSNAGGFKHSCPHCGQGFTTTVGLHYHEKNKVCGDPSDAPSVPPSTTSATATPGHSGGNTPAAAPPQLPILSTPNFKAYSAQQQQSAAAQRPTTDPYSTPNSISVSQPQPSSGGHDPYAHLTAQQYAALQEELHQAEVVYGERMNQARALPDENERRARLEGLRNSFGTKQSMIRKKYGVRLRERRTKAAIDAERARMESGATSRVASGGPASSPAPASTPARPSAWTAANASSSNTPTAGHEAKRQRLENGEKAGVSSPHDGQANSSPHKAPSANMSVDEQNAPTSLPSLSYSQAGAHVQIHVPSRSASVTENGRTGGTDTEMRDAGAGEGEGGDESDNEGIPKPEPPPAQPALSGLADLVALSRKVLGDKAANNNNDTESESSSSDDDGDIPAKLPEAVRRTLTPGNRPGSSSASK